MSRTMLDTTTPAAIPAGGWDLLAGYVNGALIKPSYPGLVKRFPDAVVVGIDTQNRPGSAQVLDIEKGDATPADAPGWFDHSLALGVDRPTLYFPASSWADVRMHMGRRRFDFWVAAYGVKACPIAGAVAWQFVDHGPNGENFDVSTVFDETWPGATPPPPPAPPRNRSRFYAPGNAGD